MPDRVILLTVPGLAAGHLPHMPHLRSKLSGGDRAALAPTCPCTAGPVRANMVTGVTCGQHGIVADHLYLREHNRLESDPAWSDFLDAPTIWQILSEHEPAASSAVCFVPGSHACRAAVTCNVDRGQQSLLTHPTSLAAELCLPAAPSSDPAWAANVVGRLVAKRPPEFLWCEFSQLAEAAELHGPDSSQVREVARAVDAALGLLFSTIEQRYGSPPLWLIVSPFTVSATNHVLYPNRLLLEAGFMSLGTQANAVTGPRSSRAWALTDHQISHVYLRHGDPEMVPDVVHVFLGRPGVAEVLAGDERSKYDLLHERAGDVIVISTPDSRQVATVESSDERASTIRGSYGAPATSETQRGTIFASERGVLAGRLLLDTDICDLVLRQFGI